MKGAKKFFIYLAIIIGVLIVVVLSIFAFMYFSPGTPVLGFEYVAYKKSATEKFSASTNPSIQNVKSFEIYAGASDIYIYPNEEVGEIKIVERYEFTGFTKAINATLNVSKKVINKQYEENSNNLKTFIVELTEPTGWVSSNKSRTEVYLPNSLALNTILAKTTGGNVYYASNKGESILTCTNLFLSTSKNGAVDIKNNQNTAYYYLATENGSVNFNNLESVTAEQVKFQTSNGSLKITNANNNCVLQSNLVVTSNSTGSGPYININKLNGNIQAETNTGTFVIDEIGSTSNNKNVYLTTNKSSIQLGTVYGHVSILSPNVQNNNVKINKLIYTYQVNTIATGAGSCTIKELQGDVAIESTSGSINVEKATYDSNVNVYSKSGGINVNYIDPNTYADPNDKDKKLKENNYSKTLKVITHTGNINLNNVSCHLEVKVLSDSANSACNIGFTAVAAGTNENIINAFNRKVSLTFIGTGKYTMCRVVSANALVYNNNLTGAEFSAKDDRNDDNNDYLLDSGHGYIDNGYAHNYRINYSKYQEVGSEVELTEAYTSGDYNSKGIILIKTSQVTNAYPKAII